MYTYMIASLGAKFKQKELFLKKMSDEFRQKQICGSLS